MASDRKSSPWTYSYLLRKKGDTNKVLSNLANSNTVENSGFGGLNLPSWLLPAVAIASLLTLIVVTSLVANLELTKPNASDVVAKAREATFEVSCGNAAGTGVGINIPTPDGFNTAVLSAAHIFDECAEGSPIIVTASGRNYRGVLAKKDPQKSSSTGMFRSSADIALIMLVANLPKLDPAPQARVGDWAVMLGNPWTKTNYATFGIISEVNGSEYGTDAAGNPGNSGGPLLDSHARVLGIMSYISLHAENDIYQFNESDVYDQDHGMAFAKRLKLACPRVLSRVSDCPFKY